MGDKSKIEWTEATWNPIVGCSIVSPGCTNCYAMKMAARIEAMSDGTHAKHVGARGIGLSHYTGTTEPGKSGAVWTGLVRQTSEHNLQQPLRWKRGRTIFVNSMGDLFHESVPDEWIDQIFAVMALCPQHIFQVLTKRAERMQRYLHNEHGALEGRIFPHWARFGATQWGPAFAQPQPLQLPLPNVWLGVSAEDQKRAHERIPHLLRMPAAVRFVSAEPLLGPIHIAPWLHDSDCTMLTTHYAGCSCSESREVRLDWVIVGGESGPNARPMHPNWARGIRGQCLEAQVPFFFKQWGEWVSVSEVEGAGEHFRFPDGATVRRTGKKLAGRTLDGCEYGEMPERANG